MGISLAALGATIVVGALTWYFLTINTETVPEGVALFAIVILAGMGANIAGVVVAPTGLVWALGGVSWFLGVFILWLLTQRRLPDGELVVKVGDPMPALAATAITAEGEGPFDLSSLKGQKVLFKFFRGSW